MITVLLLAALVVAVVTVPAAAARLLDIDATAAYLSLSTWTVRQLVADGHLVPVRLPGRLPGEASRRLLFDRADLDAWIDTQKATSDAAPNRGLSQAALKAWGHRRKRGAA